MKVFGLVGQQVPPFWQGFGWQGLHVVVDVEVVVVVVGVVVVVLVVVGVVVVAEDEANFSFYLLKACILPVKSKLTC